MIREQSSINGKYLSARSTELMGLGVFDSTGLVTGRRGAPQPHRAAIRSNPRLRILELGVRGQSPCNALDFFERL
jgi:hypothetical protein